MPRPTPFFPRSSAVSETLAWKDWAGYYTARYYSISPEREYNAIRQGAALIDVTPLYKYDVTGPGAGDFLSYVMVRSVKKMKPGRMTYLCWCDDDGKVLDDGTCARLGESFYRVTAAAPSFHWFAEHAQHFDVTVREVTSELAAVALQGPTSREVLRQVCDADMDALRFFGITETRFAGLPGWLSRTGYTGDLGYELWVENEYALGLWDALMAEGKGYGIVPCGLDAMDIARIEAGFIMQGIDYQSANECLIDDQTSSPYEIGLGWTVKFKNRGNFLGKRALLREKAEGSRWHTMGLDIEWEPLEKLFADLGLPPQVPTAAWRTSIPVYRRKKHKQVGYATSGAWSPILKRNLAIATLERSYSEPGTELDFEITVEHQRCVVPCTVVKPPFFDPPRKRS